MKSDPELENLDLTDMDTNQNWTERKNRLEPPDLEIWIRRTKFGLYGEMNPRPETRSKVRTKYGVYNAQLILLPFPNHWIGCGIGGYYPLSAVIISEPKSFSLSWWSKEVQSCLWLLQF